MTMNLLRQIAGSRLPVSFYRNEDIDSVRVLRAAGLVVALVPSPGDALGMPGTPASAQVLAVTQKGREELARFDYPFQASHPDARAPRWRWRMPRIKTLNFARRSGAPSTPREPARPQ
ncbi:hypothetical protein VLK31_25695 [Variovorax sp. H27-G14]|uniref:hypothetical protein n=1 Tax=Variovorax sp. H27-G14 TaxID=3111914 RepID=UPI0038FCAE4D